MQQTCWARLHELGGRWKVEGFVLLLPYRNVLKSVLVLLPLLGLTWLFGLLAANPWNTATATAFQWLFVIFNSLQVGVGRTAHARVHVQW